MKNIFAYLGLIPLLLILFSLCCRELLQLILSFEKIL